MDIVRKETDYALRCLIWLGGLEGDTTERVKRVAAEASLPEPMLRKILQRLAKSGIVASTKGCNGGVRLARSPREVTLFDVIESVQGPVRVSQCSDPRQCCENMSECRLRNSIADIQCEIEAVFKKKTLQDLLDEAGGEQG
jgi:Rrf2 family protein